MNNKDTNNNNAELAEDSGSDDTTRRGVRGGRQAGVRNWTERDTDTLLDMIESVLPTGGKQWEIVALRLHKAGVRNRPARACQRRFNRLANVDKPTGSAEVPGLVHRAKDIKMMIDAAEVIGFVKKNELDNNDEDDDANEGNRLSGTNLTDKDGNLRRPETKKRRIENLHVAVSNVADQQVAAAGMIANAIAELGAKLQPTAADDELKAKVDSLETQKWTFFLTELVQFTIEISKKHIIY